MKKSAGILMYKRENDKIKVLLCHPGGPYWEGTNLHCWGIPKGELDGDERVIDTAIREFKEETNLKVTKDGINFLASKKVSNNKLVILFLWNGQKIQELLKIIQKMISMNGSI